MESGDKNINSVALCGFSVSLCVIKTLLPVKKSFIRGTVLIFSAK